MAAATVFTVKNGNGDKRHFTVSEEGQVVECESYQAGFGEKLLELHPSRGFEHNGVWHSTHRFSLCWAPLETYAPKSAEELAALRATRERKKAEREEREYQEKYPLFARADNRPTE